MSDFRCKTCKQLQFKYRLDGNKLKIEVKCYNCNTFSYFTVYLDRLKDKKYEESKINNKRKQ